MSTLRYVARRAAFAVASVYAVVSVLFVLSDLMWRFRIENILARSRAAGVGPEEIHAMRRQLLEDYGLDGPLHVRYVEWLWDFTTLQWGRSVRHGEPVVDVILGPAVTTLSYVVPGVVVAMALGTVLGVAAALAKDGGFDVSVRVLAYTLLAVPAFVAVDYVVYAGTATGGTGVATWLVDEHPSAFAAVLVAASLLAGQLRFGRAASLQQTGEPFVRLLHAKGMGRLTVARHVLRNAALPVVSMSTEIIPVLTLDVFVIEEVLPIDGFAAVIIDAMRHIDVAVLIWSSMVYVVVGILGSFLLDGLYGYLDPRVRAE